MKAWLVPLVLGLAVAGLTMALGPRLIDTRPALHTTWEEAAQQPYLLPFPDALGGVSIVVAPQGQGTANSGLERDGLPAATWWTRAVGQVALPRTPSADSPKACPCIGNGTTAVEVTAYIFREGGTLLASNDVAPRAARFPPDEYHSPLPNATWRIKDGPAPPGTRELPAQWQPILQPLLANLEGLRVGDVASAVVPTHPHSDLVGPLYVTVRIEALHPAPAPVSAAPA